MSGGRDNVASGLVSSVSGGENNLAGTPPSPAVKATCPRRRDRSCRKRKVGRKENERGPARERIAGRECLRVRSSDEFGG